MPQRSFWGELSRLLGQLEPPEDAKEFPVCVDGAWDAIIMRGDTVRIPTIRDLFEVDYLITTESGEEWVAVKNGCQEGFVRADQVERVRDKR